MLDDVLNRSDVIIIPGAGVREEPDKDGNWLHPWGIARVEMALELYSSIDEDAYFIAIGGGSPHKNPSYDNGNRVFDCSAITDYLHRHGIYDNRIISVSELYGTLGYESSSKLILQDTIGDVFSSRGILENRNPETVHIVTNKFHYERACRLFDYIFNLVPALPFSNNLAFYCAENDGIDRESLDARVAKERERTEYFFRQVTENEIDNINDFDRWLRTCHDAYKDGGTVQRHSGAVVNTY